MLLLARDCLPEIASRIARAHTTKVADLQEKLFGNTKKMDLYEFRNINNVSLLPKDFLKFGQKVSFVRS